MTETTTQNPRYAALSPEVRELLEWNASRALPADAGIDEIRAANTAMNDRYGIAHVPVQTVRDVAVDGTHSPAFLRIYEPLGANGRTRPAIIFFHGGSWMLGSVDSHDSLCRQICRETGLKVLSAEYGLGPENPFPKQTEDCCAIYDWVSNNRAALDLSKNGLILCGDSSGANLVAVLTHELKSRGADLPLAQILIYPSVALNRHRQYQSWKDYGTGFLIGESSFVRTLRYYLGREEFLDDPRASPILYPDFSGLPPALVLTADFDPIRDGGRDYAARLVSAGVATRFVEYSGTTHGFLSYGLPADQTQRALSDIKEFVEQFGASE